MELKKLDRAIYIAVFAFIAVVLFIIISIQYRPWSDWMSVVRYRDQVQKEYGLTMKNIKVSPSGYLDTIDECISVDSLTPNGRAEILGFRVGDIPLSPSVSHGPFLEEGWFYAMLAHDYEWGPREREIEVINLADFDKNWREKIRVISLDNELPLKKGK
ncbi:MAG TPA: hypothetical protein PK747_09545 [Acidobacteriota bacterium]|jgi:hypothetical protein|nr:hypothetical protein [Acidobacteriota bacterium]HNT18577.1 hypothetical protein [Acidobacteriota bacterium]HPA27974.1 hypothetical protein [Acidobacteriota bacterium]HQO20902.1 hypothetical protein [Acidobacteriota bacterium]HQQ47635.1 hypothetical protein [Acidobacteriota bacterium]